MDRTTMYILVAIITVLVYMWTNERYPNVTAPMRDTVSSIAARVARVSARAATTHSPKVAADEVDAFIGADCGTCTNLTPKVCSADDKSCKDYRSVSEEEKKAHEQRALAFMAKYPKNICLYFAPWCPHCHALIPVYLSAVNGTPGINAAIINCELLPRSAITGETPSIYPVPHFPAVVVTYNNGSKKILDSVSPDSIVAAWNGTTSDSEAALQSFFS